MASRMGPEIARVQHVVSPLFDVAVAKDQESRELRPGEKRGDQSRTDLLVRMSWPDFLPHLKWVLFNKGPAFTFTVVTDARIKSVFVGDESFKSRPMSMKDEATINNLDDLVGGYNLAIVKLGYLGHKNKAAPGALREALMGRASLNKPTWVIEDPRSMYAWEHSSSPEVVDFLSTWARFPASDGSDYTPAVYDGDARAADVGIQVFEEEPAPPKRTATRKKAPEVTEEPAFQPFRGDDFGGDMSDLTTTGAPRKKKWKSSW